jgi:resorcinol 4-hydroxylase (FADH2)
MKLAEAHIEQTVHPSEMAERARSFRAMLEENARATELAGRVSAEMTAKLKEAGLYTLGLPARFGGAELTPSQMLQVGYEIGRGCGSTAWCLMIANMASLFVSNFPLEAQQDVWGENPGNLLCGVPTPIGTYREVAGGYELQPGEWPYGSNSDNSEWCFLGAKRIDGPDGPPEVGVFLLPMSEIRIIEGTWNCVGMQGTGSKTLAVDNPVFVPAHRYLNFVDAMKGATPGSNLADNPLAKFNITTFGATGFVAPLLGMAQGGLDWFVDKMKGKVKNKAFAGGPPSSVAQTSAAQVVVGETSAALDAAMLLLRDALETAENKLLSGQEPSIQDRVNIRRAFGYCAVQASNSIHKLFESAGAGSTMLDCALQRHWRDIGMASRHVNLDTQVIFSLVGQERFGLELTAAY